MHGEASSPPLHGEAGWGGLAAGVRSVIGLALEFPEEGLHGLLAAYAVLLSDERCLIGIDLGEVFLTGFDGCFDRGEALTDEQLVDGRRGGTIVDVCILYEQRGAVRVRGSGLTVFTDEVSTAGVTIFLRRLSQ